MGADFVPEGHGPRSELCPGQSAPAEGTSVRVTAFGQSVEHVAAAGSFHQMSKSISSRVDADRHITGVHERAEGVQVAAVQQVEGEAVGTDGHGSAICVEGEPPGKRELLLDLGFHSAFCKNATDFPL
jgi:hypothetical protein